MSEDGTKQELDDEMHGARKIVSESAHTIEDDVQAKTREFWQDAGVAVGDANDKVADAPKQVDTAIEKSKAQATEQAEDASDRISDALSAAGDKFGGLIDKAKSMFGGDSTER